MLAELAPTHCHDDHDDENDHDVARGRTYRRTTCSWARPALLGRISVVSDMSSRWRIALTSRLIICFYLLHCSGRTRPDSDTSDPRAGARHNRPQDRLRPARKAPG